VLGILEKDPPPYYLNITDAEKLDPNDPDCHTWQVNVELENPTELTGYDVRCIAIFNGPYFFQMQPKFYPQTPLLKTSFNMQDADAYTALYSEPTEEQPPPGGFPPGGMQGYIRGKLVPPGPDPTSTLNGYLRYASNDELRSFAPHAKVEEEFNIYFPSGTGTFGYAVDASWDSDPANAHCIEPWKVEVELAEGSPDHLC